MVGLKNSTIYVIISIDIDKLLLMNKIIPLDGYIVAKPTTELQSIETEMTEVQGMKFLVVDSTARRSEAVGNKTRIRLFSIISVSDCASDKIKGYVGKNMYCVCFENENANNIVIDKDTGDKLFIIPETDIMAELRNTNN